MMFEPSSIIPDTETHRTCGTCGPQPIDAFYKDGTDSSGNVKYRRDCKDCYRITRLRSRRGKKKPVEVLTKAQRQRTQRRK
jgi:hypothetical protein